MFYKICEVNPENNRIGAGVCRRILNNRIVTPEYNRRRYPISAQLEFENLFERGDGNVGKNSDGVGLLADILGKRGVAGKNIGVTERCQGSVWDGESSKLLKILYKDIHFRQVSQVLGRWGCTTLCEKALSATADRQKHAGMTRLIEDRSRRRQTGRPT